MGAERIKVEDEVRLAGEPTARAVWLERAVELLSRGRLVAFPTETVYGLGADATNEGAVRAIFAAKGRPARNPLIVHTYDADVARGLAAEWPAAAEQLAAAFWPGPLTIVVSQRGTLPACVTAGGATVGLRVPSHPVARALLRESGLAIAAPSANRSTRVSPTTADHVADDLGERVDLILDSGPTPGGIESTVVRVEARGVRVLRPGLITASQLRDAVGLAVVDGMGDVASEHDSATPLPSPGRLAKHYAPETPLECLEFEAALARTGALRGSGLRVGFVAFGDVMRAGRFPQAATVVSLAAEPVEAGRQLYAALHRIDAERLHVVVVAMPPADEAWAAIRDRLQRASV